MIEVRGLSRFYGAHRAVNDVSFSIGANEVVGFLGLNGAGKSTTLKIIAGLIPPSVGTVIVDGVDVTTAPVSFRASIGFLPEEPPLYDEMTVIEFLRFLGRLRGLDSETLTARIPRVLEMCQLTEQCDRLISELSHGYKKRVGIAQAIIHQPKLVILDEPISGLDPQQIVDMRAVIKGLSTEATVLLSSHILSEISQTCDRVLVLKDGRKIADGSESELSTRSTQKLCLVLRQPAADKNQDSVRKFLEDCDFVETFQITPSTETGLVEVVVELSSDQREDLVSGLVHAGVGVRKIEDTMDELEEIFMAKIKEGVA